MAKYRYDMSRSHLLYIYHQACIGNELDENRALDKKLRMHHETRKHVKEATN